MFWVVFTFQKWVVLRVLVVSGKKPRTRPGIHGCSHFLKILWHKFLFLKYTLLMFKYFQKKYRNFTNEIRKTLAFFRQIEIVTSKICLNLSGFFSYLSEKITITIFKSFNILEMSMNYNR